MFSLKEFLEFIDWAIGRGGNRDNNLRRLHRPGLGLVWGEFFISKAPLFLRYLYFLGIKQMKTARRKFKIKVNRKTSVLANAYRMPEDLISSDEDVEKYLKYSQSKLCHEFEEHVIYSMYFFFRFELVKFVDKKFEELSLSLIAIQSQTSKDKPFSEDLIKEFDSMRLKINKNLNPDMENGDIGKFSKKFIESDIYNPGNLSRKDLRLYARNKLYELITRVGDYYQFLNRKKEYDNFLEQFILNNKKFLKNLGAWQVREAQPKIDSGPSVDNLKCHLSQLWLMNNIL